MAVRVFKVAELLHGKSLCRLLACKFEISVYKLNIDIPVVHVIPPKKVTVFP